MYRVTAKHPVTDKQIQQLLSGVKLDDSDEMVRAAECSLVSEKVLDLTIYQGKYHQVKRMLAAVSNRVEALERIQFGKLELPANLPLGEWTWVNSPSEIY